jgi:hypothetical protein
MDIKDEWFKSQRYADRGENRAPVQKRKMRGFQNGIKNGKLKLFNEE